MTIAVNFTSSKFIWPVTFKLNDKFYFIENQFYNEYLQYKNKKCFFISNGLKLQPEKTLFENKNKVGDNIMVNCIEF